MPTFDVLDAGRMAVLADPAGAVFCVWEPKENIGAHLLRERGALSWFELLTQDASQAGPFYAELFDYELEPFGPDGSYTVFKKGDTQMGGMMSAPSAGMPSFWGLYFTVGDVDGVADKVRAAGGQIMMGPQDMPKIGRISVMADPQGAVFGVING
jgi:predicted enzyme related to lactoylglutathione lyase